jgi:hypothetical protein
MTRRQLLILSLVVVVAVVVVQSSAAVPGVPPGVKPENWRSISSDVGLAIQDMGPGYQGPMVGTLMVRPRFRSGRSLRPLGSPLNARPLDERK